MAKTRVMDFKTQLIEYVCFSELCATPLFKNKLNAFSTHLAQLKFNSKHSVSMTDVTTDIIFEWAFLWASVASASYA